MEKLSLICSDNRHNSNSLRGCVGLDLLDTRSWPCPGGPGLEPLVWRHWPGGCSLEARPGPVLPSANPGGSLQARNGCRTS